MHNHSAGDSCSAAKTVFSAACSDLHLLSDLVNKEGEEILDKFDHKGYSVLHWACFGGQKENVCFVLSRGKSLKEDDLFYVNANGDKILNCNPNIQSNNELLLHPLHWIAQMGHTKLVDLFLNLDCDINVLDAKKCTPLVIAIQNEKTVMVFYLISSGAITHNVDEEGDTVLHWAAYKGNAKLVDYFLAQGFDTRKVDNFYQTPLHLACLSGYLTVVKSLLRYNGDFLARDKNGKNCIDLATKKGHKAVVDLLLQVSKSGVPPDKSRFLKEIDMLEGDFIGPVFWRTKLAKSLINAFFVGYYVLLNIITLHYMGAFINFNFFWIVLYFNFFGFIMSFFRLKRSDPGFVTRNDAAYIDLLKDLTNNKSASAILKKSESSCDVCKCLVPFRSFHCLFCNQCVSMYNMHDQTSGVCIGQQNRALYVIYQLSLIGMIIHLFVMNYISTSGTYLHILTLCLLFFNIGVNIFHLLMMLFCISQSLTMFEYFDWKYHPDLNHDGVFFNPYMEGGKITNLFLFFKRDIYQEFRKVFWRS